MQAYLAFFQIESIPMPLIVVFDARHDSAVGAGRIDPGGEAERVLVVELSNIPSIDEALPVEYGSLAHLGGD